MFSTFDCAVKGYRQKEDPWNAIISGFLTGGCLAARGGPQMIVSSGIACGVLLGVIEGVGVLMQRVFAEGNRQSDLSSLYTDSPPLLTLATFLFPKLQGRLHRWSADTYLASTLH